MGHLVVGHLVGALVGGWWGAGGGWWGLVGGWWGAGGAWWSPGLGTLLSTVYEF